MRWLSFLVVWLCLAISAHAVTFVWDHDLENTTGFRLYYGEYSGQYPFLVADAQFSDLSITIDILPQGYYALRAYNETGESDLSNEVLLAAYYYNSIRYEYDSGGKIIYKGEHTSSNASVDDTNWVISKYYYLNDVVVQVRIRTTSWANRESGW